MADEKAGIAISLVRKIASIALAVFVLLSFNFLAFMVMPGDPLASFFPHASTVNWEFVEEARLNDSLTVQYLDYLADTLTWELRPSIVTNDGEDIQDFIFDHIWRTLALLTVALVGSFAAGAGLERLARSGRAEKRALVVHGCALIMFVPAVAFAWIVWLANFEWGGLPLSGDGTIVDEGESYLISVAQSAFLPVLTILLSSIGLAILMFREGLLKSQVAGGVKGPWLSTFALGAVRLRPLAHFYVAWTMLIVLLVDWVFRYGGLGSFVIESFNHRDLSGLMAATFIIPMVTMFAASTVSLSLHLISRRGVREALNDWARRDPAPANEVRPVAREGATSKQWALSVWRAFRSSKVAVSALALLVILTTLGILAPVLATVPDPTEYENWEVEVTYGYNPLPPSLDRSTYTGWLHPLGTDGVGRDVYSMWLYSARSGTAIMLGLMLASVALGLMAGLSSARDSVDSRLPRTARVIGDFFLTAGARAFVAIPLVLVIAMRSHFDPYNTTAWYNLVALLLTFYAWAWMLVARPVRAVARRAGNSLNMRWVTPVALAESLSVAKFAAPAVMVTMFIGSGADLHWISEYDWGTMFSWAIQTWYAWHAVIPPVLGMLLLCAGAFVFLDRLEHAVRVTALYPMWK